MSGAPKMRSEPREHDAHIERAQTDGKCFGMQIYTRQSFLPSGQAFEAMHVQKGSLSYPSFIGEIVLEGFLH